MRNAILAGLVAAGIFTQQPSPSPDAGPPDPAPISPSPGLHDLVAPPYEPASVQEAIRRLAHFKGLTHAQYHEHPEQLIANQQDLGRFFAYLAAIAMREGYTKWAIAYYCYAIQADPRYVMLSGIPADANPDFLGLLSQVHVEAIKFLAEQVARERVNPQPSQLRKKED